MRTLIQNELSRDQEQEKLLAQWIACSFLLRACESSLVELTNATKATNDEGAAYLLYRAGDVLEEITSSWRETLNIVSEAALSDATRSRPEVAAATP